MKVVWVEIGKVTPYAGNPRQGAAVAKVAASIREFGWRQPIVVDENRVIIAGHTRHAAGLLLGEAKVPIHVAKGLTPTQVRAYRLADNRVAEEASWDDEALLGEIRALDSEGFDVDLIGFDEGELDRLLASGEGRQRPNADDAPEPEEMVVSRLGDVWSMGLHRLRCGDATDMQAMQVLMSGESAHMVFTDPPYLMNFQGALDGAGRKRSRHKKIVNDDLKGPEAQKFLTDSLAMIRLHCTGAWYVCFYRLGLDKLFRAASRAGLKWRNLIIWEKGHITLSNSDYKSTYEPIMVGWADDWEPVLYGWELDHRFHGHKGEKDVWEVEIPSIWAIDRTSRNDLHPTMKPVELCERAILNSSQEKEIVLDLFGGSGSTLIACERTKRTCRMMELEPNYCDVIVKRWQDWTGSHAIRQDGLTFEEAARTN